MSISLEVYLFGGWLKTVLTDNNNNGGDDDYKIITNIFEHLNRGRVVVSLFM